MDDCSPADAEATLAQAKANLAKARATRAKAEQDQRRALQLFSKGGISAQDRDTAVEAASTAKADTEADEAAVQQAELSSIRRLARQRTVEWRTKRLSPGDYLQVGQNLFALVTPERWVTANFKETQLRNMRARQPAQVSLHIAAGRVFRR
jgi:membrane fusion protein, multidrug efflux system